MATMHKLVSKFSFLSMIMLLVAAMKIGDSGTYAQVIEVDVEMIGGVNIQCQFNRVGGGKVDVPVFDLTQDEDRANVYLKVNDAGVSLSYDNDNYEPKGRTQQSVDLMRKMLNEGILPDTVTFSCLLEDMCGRGGALEANKLRLLASNKGFRPDSMVYRILVSGYAREGRRKEGEVVVNEMFDKGFIPDIATYNVLINGLSKSKS